MSLFLSPSSDHMFLGVSVGLGVHLMVTCVVTNKPLIHASEGKQQFYLFFASLALVCTERKYM